ncbi:hypothetical protein M3147_00675 [Agromyces mediolanus]|uniref:hypothetical protein n=1 Tax=Agromyces mediolanus TaxID=41986 RepID=UPI00203DA305|nr:hypothetical protein [Agromyces mediolanus]MCM3655761.1 hypothetical protein [Agromyces mediolanus]
MASARLALARARARSGVLAGVAAVVLVLAGVGTAIIDQTAGAAVTGLRDRIGAVAGADGAVRWEIRRSIDPEAQAEAGAEVLDRTLPAETIEWTRSAESSPVPTVDGVDTVSEAGLVLLADPAAAERARLVDGAWPDASNDPAEPAPETDADADAGEASAPIPTAVHAGAADALGLAVGDTVELADRRLQVVGTWLPDDARAPAWFGEPLIATGSADGAAGPFLVDEDALDRLPVAVRVRWTATPIIDTLTPDSARALTADIARTTPALAAQPGIGEDGLSQLGGLPATIDAATTGLDAVRAITPLPLLLLAAAGIAALGRLGTLLAGARRGETVLLRARGAATRQLVGWQAGEAAAVAAPAAVAGAAAGELALLLLRPGEPRSMWIAAAVAAAAVLVAVLLLAGSAWGEARRPVTRSTGEDSGRGTRAAALGGTVLVAVAAAVSLWQFRLYGSPLVRTAAGGTAVDPLAVLAPVLVLLALALGALACTPFVSRLLERVASARPGLVPSLPLRQLARRAPMFAAASFTAMLGVAGIVLTATVAGSWQRFDADAAALATGGEVRVVGAADPTAAADAAAELPGAVVEPVVRREIRVGPETATLIATGLDTLPQVAPGLPDDVHSAIRAIDAADASLLPVAIDEQLAAGTSAAPGDRISLRLGSADGTIDAQVAAVVQAVPGAGALGVLADRADLDAAVADAGARTPSADELWLGTPDPTAVVAAFDRDRPGGAVALARATASTANLVSPAITALWLGAIGALAAALAALIALAAAFGASRRGEVLVLRALGAPAAMQGRARFAELAAAVGTAMVLGAAIGAVAAWATAAELARAAVPAAPAALTPTLAIEWWPLAAALAAFALATAAVALLSAHTVTAAAGRPGREEVR